MSNSNERLISHRIRRQWFWLGLAVVVHVAALVAVLTLVVGGRVAPVGVAAAAAALVIGAPITAFWLERRDAVRHRPDRWLRRALLVVVAHACAVGLASSAGTAEWQVQALLVVALAVVELVCVVMAGRALRFPLTPELGEMAVEVSEKIRSEHQAGTPVWALQDEMRLTDEGVVAILSPGAMSAFGIGVRLADVEAVSVRPGRAADNPWVRLDGGERYFVTGEEVIELRHRGGTMVVPVCNAAAFAEVIRARIAVCHGIPTSS
ncbi:hypothetical protein [Pseudonocardia sp. MH-G8]|uniref:hypothetical protein n=1 Tax=Pseudonocardia sp. MH-G8 TaxID=1854588 RepID=UPI00117A392B|nr:hypothetical protein [Pseudonocardia sp. MH-G8]